MNFLAHAYLSFGDPALLVGNMIGDFVKGNKYIAYPLAVQEGVRLHRAIDSFTDQHPATRYARSFFKKDYGLYSGAFVDVVYDHFLCNDENCFSNAALEAFSLQVYTILQAHYEQLPPVFQQMLYYMQSQNWLYGYRQREGVFKAFGGIVRRAKYIDSMTAAFEDFEQYYADLRQCYRDFFPELEQFVRDRPPLRS